MVRKITNPRYDQLVVGDTDNEEDSDSSEIVQISPGITMGGVASNSRPRGPNINHQSPNMNAHASSSRQAPKFRNKGKAPVRGYDEEELLDLSPEPDEATEWEITWKAPSGFIKPERYNHDYVQEILELTKEDFDKVKAAIDQVMNLKHNYQLNLVRCGDDSKYRWCRRIESNLKATLPKRVLNTLRDKNQAHVGYILYNFATLRKDQKNRQLQDSLSRQLRTQVLQEVDKLGPERRSSGHVEITPTIRVDVKNGHISSPNASFRSHTSPRGAGGGSSSSFSAGSQPNITPLRQRMQARSVGSGSAQPRHVDLTDIGSGDEGINDSGIEVQMEDQEPDGNADGGPGIMDEGHKEAMLPVRESAAAVTMTPENNSQIIPAAIAVGIWALVITAWGYMYLEREVRKNKDNKA
ncbi:hypothetical protein ABW21_db0203867 [Orbilia brochopaga]|nr:hypothetical protein ABW21_db0203867 [Drechslerella brochopaga]